jgi:hypothetical protein
MAEEIVAQGTGGLARRTRRPARGGRWDRARVLAALLALAVSFASLPLPAATPSPAVKNMTYRFQESKILVSLDVANAFDRPDMKEAILSTRPVNITYTIELIKHRTAWTNRTVVRRKVVHRATYDNLTHQFTLETLLDGKTEDERVVETYEEVERYLARLEDFPVTSVANLDPSGQGTYSVRAMVHLLDDFALWIIPWDVQTPWHDVPLATP